MNENIVEAEEAELDTGLCVCKDGPTLAILKDVQRMYEEKMDLIERIGGSKKLQLQLDVLRAWVNDLVGQNTLLVRAVEDLEAEATTKLVYERKRHSEVVSELRSELAAVRRRLARKDSDLRGLVEVLRRLREFDNCTLDGIHFFEITESDIFGSFEWRQKKLTGYPVNQRTLKESKQHKANRYYRLLQYTKKGCGKFCELKLLNESLRKENIAKDREIRQLNKDAQQYEQTILNLRKEISLTKCTNTPDVSKRDAEVMAGMCCTGTECGDWEPVKDFSEMLHDETLQFQERIQQMESNLKSSSDSVRALRKVNVSLTEEMQAIRRLCAALVEENRAASVRAQFKDDIIREMRRQLKQAKAKTELCPCTVATNIPEKNQTTCACARVCGQSDGTTVERMSVYCQYFATTSTSGHTKITCLCSRDIGSPDVSVKGMAVCCQWSAKSCPDKEKVFCECSRDFPGISIIGRPPSPPILISDVSNEELQIGSTKCTPFNCPLPKDSSSSCSGPCPGPSTLVCRNSTLPACSDLNISKICPKSCIKFDAFSHKTVQMQIPEVRDSSQECDEKMLNEHSNEGRCNIEECNQNRETTSTSPNRSICQAVKTLVSRSCSGAFKDSSGACSLMDSATGSCEANTQASYYHNKLVSTLQILQNREETIRVQAESLAVAEERISALTERAAELRRDLERKSKEMLALRQTLECYKVEKVDVSVMARGDSEVEQKSDMMSTLQSNLSVIEDLYRECFYETAKQEDLIDLLRKSYLDVRLMDKQKADQIGRLQNVINAQKLSLDKCQEIASEVDTLKIEISNFLSSSTSTNNDSGMWERSEESFATTPEVHEELQEVMEQLLRLRDILNDPCTCGLQNEIRRLKQKNEALQSQTTELWQRNCELEKQLQAKDEAKDSLEKKCKEEVKTREEQLKCVRRELAIMLESSKDQAITCGQLTTQLRQTEELLGDKSEELVRMQQQCDTQQETIDELKDEAKRAEELYKEKCSLLGEVSSLSAQAAQWRAQLAASARRQRKLEDKLRQALDCYREKENTESELQLQLEQAHARGAALCGDVRRVLCALRLWARRARDARRDQENTIKEKDEVIAVLQDRLQSRASKTMPCMCTGAEELPRSASSRRGSCSRIEAGRPQFLTTNDNEMPTCSSAPTPPRRLFRKKPPCGVTSCKGARWFCEATQQHPERHDASQDPIESYCEMPGPTTTNAVNMGNVSPTDELFRRMENLSDALADGYRRWSKSDAR